MFALAADMSEYYHIMRTSNRPLRAVRRTRFPSALLRASAGFAWPRLTGSTSFRLVSSAPPRFTWRFSSELRCHNRAFLAWFGLAIVDFHGTW
jgi:hypothetical protein